MKSCLPTFLRRFGVADSTETDQRGGAGMARNSVQFQKGLSEAAFDELYGPRINAALW